MDDTGAQPVQPASSGGVDPEAMRAQARMQGREIEDNGFQARVTAKIRDATGQAMPDAGKTALAVLRQQRALGVEKISVPASGGTADGTLQLDFYNGTQLLLAPDASLTQQGRDVTSSYDAAGFAKLRWAINDMLNGGTVPSDFSTSVSQNGSAVAVSSAILQTFSKQQLQPQLQPQQQPQQQQQDQPAGATAVAATLRPAGSGAAAASAGGLASAVIAAAVLLQLLL